MTGSFTQKYVFNCLIIGTSSGLWKSVAPGGHFHEKEKGYAHQHPEKCVKRGIIFVKVVCRRGQSKAISGFENNFN
jgi:hypothetical protein